MKRRPHRKDGILWLAWFIFRSKWHFFSLRERNDQRRHREILRQLDNLAAKEKSDTRRFVQFKSALDEAVQNQLRILWHVSGEDPRYAMTKCANNQAVKTAMATRAAQELRRGVLKSDAIIDDLISEFRCIPGAYTNPNALRRQAYRILKKLRRGKGSQDR